MGARLLRVLGAAVLVAGAIANGQRISASSTLFDAIRRADMAAVTGCQTLAGRVSQGQIYKIGGGEWQIKGAGPIALPDYCATASQ